MNWYFYKIFIPLVILWGLSAVGLAIGILNVNWWIVFVSWFLLGPVGIGVGYHRLFSHRQFETSRPVELILAFLGTLAAYAPIVFWITNHQFHHKTSDQQQDPSSPELHGFWQSFLTYRLKESTLEKVDLKNYCSRRLIMDPKMRWMSKHFTKIVWSTIIILGIIDFSLLLSAYLLPVFIEHIRVNVVSSLSHMEIPLSYRNHATEDRSFNNILLGFLTMGFAWHNNHHFNERKLVLTDQWWEIDIEGQIAKMLSR